MTFFRETSDALLGAFVLRHHLDVVEPLADRNLETQWTRTPAPRDGASYLEGLQVGLTPSSLGLTEKELIRRLDPIRLAIWLTSAVTAQVKTLHEHGHSHRDLRAAHLAISATGRPVLDIKDAVGSADFQDIRGDLYRLGLLLEWLLGTTARWRSLVGIGSRRAIDTWLRRTRLALTRGGFPSADEMLRALGNIADLRHLELTLPRRAAF